jgi:copper(I)-binding protein
LSLFVAAACDPKREPTIEISDAWVRPTLGGAQSTAAYLTISNQGAGADTLISAAVGGAHRTSLHSSSTDGGIARMRAISGGVPIPAGGTVQFAPGGNHIMIEQMNRRLEPGERVRLTLKFQRSGEYAVDAPVRAAASTPGHGGH